MDMDMDTLSLEGALRRAFIALAKPWPSVVNRVVKEIRRFDSILDVFAGYEPEQIIRAAERMVIELPKLTASDNVLFLLRRFADDTYGAREKPKRRQPIAKSDDGAIIYAVPAELDKFKRLADEGRLDWPHISNLYTAAKIWRDNGPYSGVTAPISYSEAKQAEEALEDWLRAFYWKAYERFNAELASLGAKLAHGFRDSESESDHIGNDVKKVVEEQGTLVFGEPIVSEAMPGDTIGFVNEEDQPVVAIAEIWPTVVEPDTAEEANSEQIDEDDEPIF